MPVDAFLQTVQFSYFNNTRLWGSIRFWKKNVLGWDL